MDVARLLIRAGADPSAENSRGIAAKDMVQRWYASHVFFVRLTISQQLTRATHCTCSEPHVVESLIEAGKFHTTSETTAALTEADLADVAERRKQ